MTALAAALTILAAGCDDGGSSANTQSGDPAPITPAPFTETFELTPNPVTSSTSGTVNIAKTVPVDSLAMGIAVIGTDTELKFIEHDGLFLEQNGHITGPDGAVPLSFNMINGQASPSAVNNEAAAVHFPNDGRPANLPSGTYRFPVGAADSSDGDLLVDTLNSVVFYKTETSLTPTLRLNVFVLNGVDAGITSQAQAETDAEILGALNVLQNVYGNNAATGVNVDITVEFVNDPARAACLASPGEINTEAEQFCLLGAYPETPTDDAMNIFVIASLEYLDGGNPGSGVIGLAAGIPGPFNLQGLATSGTLAEYQGDDNGTILGFTLAHEFGHFLGLFHTSQTNGSATAIVGEDPIDDTELCTSAQVQDGLADCPDFGNLMFPFVNNDADPPVSTGQGNVLKYNPGITP